MSFALGLQAPAKLNLFLHVIGRRNNGYHELQSVFAPIDLADTIDIEVRDGGVLKRDGDIVGDLDRDLALRAARMLQTASGTRLGANISIEKRIPAGSGLGGGSSDAATTLLALNRLWRLDWPRLRLAEIGATLGADVPFFLGPGMAFVSGKGDAVTGLTETDYAHQTGSGRTAGAPAEASLNAPLSRPVWAVVLWPQVHVSTAEIFAAPGLTRNHKATTIRAFSEAWAELLSGAQSNIAADCAMDRATDRATDGGAASQVGAQADVSVGAHEAGRSATPRALTPLFGSNDLQEETRRRYPSVANALRILEQFGSARMTGSGSAVFALFASENDAREAQRRVSSSGPVAFCSWVVRVLQEHPLAPW